jgi:hypothetical protein
MQALACQTNLLEKHLLVAATGAQTKYGTRPEVETSARAGE